MDSKEKLQLLVAQIDVRLKRGESAEALIQELVAYGVDAAKARQIVSIVDDSRTNNYLAIVKFYTLTSALISVVVAAAYTFLGAEEYRNHTSTYFWIFAISFGVSVLCPLGNDRLTRAVRLISTGILTVSSAFLAFAMFTHPGWESRTINTAGGWRAQVVGLAFNIAYNLGPTGVGLILTVVTLLALMTFLAECRTSNLDPFHP